MNGHNLTDGPQRFLIWDEDGQPTEAQAIPVLWRAFSPDGRVVSIPSVLEQRADTLRSRYLEWVYDLGSASIGGKRIVDWLTLRSGISLWWMTLLAEKSNAFRSPQISNVVKLMAMEETLRVRPHDQILLASRDRDLARAMSRWCARVGLEFKWQRSNVRERTPLARRLHKACPHSVQALLALFRYLQHRWRLRGAGTAPLVNSTARTTFCTYLFNLDERSVRSAHLRSAYWTGLQELLERHPEGVNWLLLFIKHRLVATGRDARRLIDDFNRSASAGHAFAALDAALGWKTIRSAVRDYLRVVLCGLRLHSAQACFTPRNSKLDFWPLLKGDWRSSLFGAGAMLNCVHLNLLEQTLRRLPRQTFGVYLQENIGWEMAFIHFWKAAGHGRLVGVPHSTVRFWDLRYFFDPRSYRRSGFNDLPMPDLVAVNGPAALEAYRRGGYPRERLVEVEALRYLHLADLPRIRRPVAGPLRVLVLGDYMQSATRMQMQWLTQAVSALPADTCFVVKPHPACPVKQGEYPSVRMQLTDSPLEMLLPDCNVAYTSNMTSAAVDAYSAGVPVVSMLDAATFNISPLRGMPGVAYVTNSTELAQALLRMHADDTPQTGGYFCLDKRLPRWRRLLSLPEAQTA